MILLIISNSTCDENADTETGVENGWIGATCKWKFMKIDVNSISFFVNLSFLVLDENLMWETRKGEDSAKTKKGKVKINADTKTLK